MNKRGGIMKVVMLVGMLGLLYGGVGTEAAAQKNGLTKCAIEAALCISKCIQKCLQEEHPPNHNPIHCIIQYMESSCAGEGDEPAEPPEEGDEPEPPPEGDEPAIDGTSRNLRRLLKGY